MKNDQHNSVAIVTGAAGNLGVAVANALQRDGNQLALFDRGEGRLATLFPDWVNSSDIVFVESTDLMDSDQVSMGVAQVLHAFGRIDVLINAAGGYKSGTPTHLTSDDEWEFLMDINSRTVLNVSRAVIPTMIEQSAGKIVNIGARPGLKGSRNAASYAASKSAVLRLTESMAAELKNEGINVNAVIPGTIDTPANREMMPDADFNKWVKPEDIADVICFLTSDQAVAIHGALVPVYGRG